MDLRDDDILQHRNGTAASVQKRSVPQDFSFPPTKSSFKTAEKIVTVSVDLGTIQSKVAYVTDATDFEKLVVTLIDHYPRDSSTGPPIVRLDARQSVPTRICYLKRSTSVNGCGSRPSTTAESDEGYDSPLDDDETDHWSGVNGKGLPRTIRQWGYEAHNKDPKEGWDTHHFSKPRLLLHPNEQAKVEMKAFREMKRCGLVDRPEHILTDLFQNLLRHTISRIREVVQLQTEDSLDFVLTVKTSHEMQIARRTFAKAFELSEISQYCRRGSLTLFLESDAAAYLVWKTQSDKSAPAAQRLVPGDSFLLLDCGGQTVDATVYEVDRLEQDRLDQKVETRSVSCGSSLLNDQMRSALVRKLDESGVVASPEGLNDAVLGFEYGEKRDFGMVDDESFGIITVRLIDDTIIDVQLGPEAVRNMFQDICGRMKELIEDHLEQARNHGLAVEIVVVTGGFCESPFIVEYLEDFFSKAQSIRKRPVQVVFHAEAETAVVRGAIQIALDKDASDKLNHR